MKCPHCSEELKYVERPGRKCAKCKREFALEPRENRFELSDLRLRGLAERLSQSGSLFYTPSQLYWQAGRKKLSQRLTLTGWIGVGLAGAIAVSLIITLRGGAWWLPLLALGLSLVLVSFSLASTEPWGKMVMPAGWDAFQPEVIGRWLQVYGAPPQGMIDERRMLEQRERRVRWEGVTAVVVGPLDVVHCLIANRASEQFGVALLPSGTKLTAAETAILRELPDQSEVPILVLHDASHYGCRVPVQLGTELGLRPEHRVVDLGLRPRTVLDYKLMKFKAEGRPSAEAVAELKALAAAGLVQLTTDEVKWLAQGNTSPVAALTPKQLMRGVERAMQRLRAAEARQARQAEERTADGEAKDVGFLTWPGAVGAGGMHEVSAL